MAVATTPRKVDASESECAQRGGPSVELESLRAHRGTHFRIISVDGSEESSDEDDLEFQRWLQGRGFQPPCATRGATDVTASELRVEAEESQLDVLIDAPPKPDLAYKDSADYKDLQAKLTKAFAKASTRHIPSVLVELIADYSLEPSAFRHRMLEGIYFPADRRVPRRRYLLRVLSIMLLFASLIIIQVMPLFAKPICGDYPNTRRDSAILIGVFFNITLPFFIFGLCYWPCSRNFLTTRLLAITLLLTLVVGPVCLALAPVFIDLSTKWETISSYPALEQVGSPAAITFAGDFYIDAWQMGVTEAVSRWREDGTISYHCLGGAAVVSRKHTPTRVKVLALAGCYGACNDGGANCIFQRFQEWEGSMNNPMSTLVMCGGAIPEQYQSSCNHPRSWEVFEWRVEEVVRNFNANGTQGYYVDDTTIKVVAFWDVHHHYNQISKDLLGVVIGCTLFLFIWTIIVADVTIFFGLLRKCGIERERCCGIDEYRTSPLMSD